MANYLKIKRKKALPLLLKNYSKMESFFNFSKIICNGVFPFCRSIKSHLKNGIINLDKPDYFNCSEIIIWIKNFFNLSKIGYYQDLDYKISGCFIIFLENSIRLIKSHTKQGKTLIGVFKFKHIDEKIKKEFSQKLEFFTGLFFQPIFLFSNVKRQLRLINIHSASIYEFDQRQKTCIIEISCDSNIYIRSLSYYFFSKFGNNCKLIELRQIRSGYLTENINLVTLHDVIDSSWFYQCKKNDFYIKKVIMPLEILLTRHKRIVVKTSAINSICYGAKLMITGVIRAEKNIGKNDEVLLISLKGEAVAIATCITNITVLNVQKLACICIPKYIIMNRDEYPKKWGIGINQIKKKLVRACGLLCVIKKKKDKRLGTWTY